MPTAKAIFRNFSNETSLHGFKRLWVGSIWRWPFWMCIIIAGTAMCIYQVKNKVEILIANPLSININLVYKDEISFPAITICSTMSLRVSYVVNSSDFKPLLRLFKYRASPPTTNETDLDKELMKTYGESFTSRDFFAQAGIPKDQLILWCRLPTGQRCSSGDFEPIITDEGFCYKLNKQMMIREAGPSNSMKILVNLAQYDTIPDFPPTGVRVVIHDNDDHPLPYMGYDVMPGYQTSILLKKAVTIQIESCEAENPLLYHKKYTYPACRSESIILEAALKCKCKPFMLPEPVSEIKNATIDNLPDCTLFQHKDCVEPSIKSNTVGTDEAVSNDTDNSSPGPISPCIGECERSEFEKELVLSVFQDDLAFKQMIGLKAALIQQAYEEGKDGSAFLNVIRKMINDYQDIYDASQSFQEIIVNKKLVPPYGTVTQILMDKVPCLNDLVQTFSNGNETREDPDKLQTKLPDTIVANIVKIEPLLDNMTIEDLLKLANSLKRTHLDTCADKPDEICSLPVFYELMEMREQLKANNGKIKGLLTGYAKNLTDSVDTFVQENGTVFSLFFKSEDERKDVKQMLEYYVNQVNICLMEIARTYERILENGQPSMKTRKLYNNYLSDLSYVNSTLFGTCRKGGLVVDSLFNVSNRNQLAIKILKSLSVNDFAFEETLKSLKYNDSLRTLATEIELKLTSSGYDMRALNQSLYAMEDMDALLKKYVTQTMDERIKKTKMFNLLTASLSTFKDGISKYKTVVKKNLNALETFFTENIDKLVDQYPGDESDLSFLRTTNNASGNLTIPIESAGIAQLICLKKAKLTIAEIEQNVLDPEAIQHYEHTVETTVNSLRVYFEDIRSLKTFYKENLGLVNIYFRDMSVKETTQTRAYDMLSFLCDVGGVVGLWLGGSMLSFFELFDLLIFENIRTMCRCKKRLKRSPNLNNNESKYDLTVLPQNEQNVQPVAITLNDKGETDIYRPATWHLYYDKSL